MTEIFGADLRSLAALRIVLAAIVLADLAGRSGNLLAHYTDDGVIPRALLITESNSWRLSLNLINGTLVVQALLFGITALAAIALLVGYRTRLMTVIVWVMVLSIQWRNPWVLSSEDALLRVLLFWSMFLPLGAWWSVDSLRNPSPRPRPMRFLSVATAGLFLQIAFMYWFTAILKSGPEWRVDGTALYYAFSADQTTSPIGSFLLQFPALLKVLTFAALGIEAIGPLLLFSPFATGPVRTVGVMLIMSLQIGILLTMRIWLFPWLGAFCMVCFLPSWFWDRVISRLPATSPWDSSLESRFRHATARLARAWSDPGWGRLSIGRSGAQPAFAGVATRAYVTQLETPSTGRSGLLGAMIPSMGAPATITRSSLAANLLALFFLGYVFVVNLATVSDFTVPAAARPLGQLFGLNQTWDMFAPWPLKRTEWFVIPGTLSDGRQLDLLAPIIHRNPNLINAVSREKPSNVRSTNRDLYWRKYLQALTEEGSEDRRLYFGKYICRTWNSWHPDGPRQLQTFEIISFKERTLPEGRRAAPEQEVLWTHNCFASG